MAAALAYYEIGKVDELPAGERWFLEVGGVPVVVFNINGDFYAIDDICSHDSGPVGEGELDGHQIICPRHGARFDVRNGKSLTPPAVENIKNYSIRITDGQLEIGLPEEE
jgi:3-phenylpropionate/trans-cinnamate dioxygenase ferredoxin component